MKTFNFKFTNTHDLESFIQVNNINKSNSVLVQIFSGSFDVEILSSISQTILQNIKEAKIIGATTDGEIMHDKVFTHSIVISFSIFTNTDICISYIDDIPLGNSYNSGVKLSKKLIKKDSKVFILFTDGMQINGEEFLNGVQSIANNVVISGGLAGDNGKFKYTLLFYNNKILKNAVVGVSLNSKILNVIKDYSFSWQSIGKEFTVTKSHKRKVYEIDGITPFELYKKYLGSKITHLLQDIAIEFPLIIQDGQYHTARAPIKILQDGSFSFAGNVEEGSKVKFAVSSENILLHDSTKLALNMSSSSTQSIFVYSCMARKRFLNKSISADVSAISKLTQVSGFFTYGEFYTSNDYSLHLLNQTMTILSLSESEEKINKSDIILQNDFDNIKINNLSALSHLIKVTSDEQSDLNKTLEQRVTQEVEKNKNTQKELYNSIKMASLGDMISNIAHQWRQPLSIITTCASAMQLHKDLNILSDEMFESYTENIVTQGKYLSETINTFREYIQDDHKLIDIIIENEIQTTIKLLSSTIKNNNIKLIQNIDFNKVTMIKLISGELSQVIINIINNAKDAFIEKNIKNRILTLELSNNNKNCLISIEDNAGGIKPNILEKIFEPYYSTKSKEEGTGIGLYMSYEIITNHLNGNLYVKNTTSGAKFFIELPLNIH